MPIFQIILIRIFDWIFNKTINRNFYPCSGRGILPQGVTILDSLITLLCVLLNVIIPIILLNKFINGRFFD